MRYEGNQLNILDLDLRSKSSGFQLFGRPEKSQETVGGCLQEQSSLKLKQFHLETNSKPPPDLETDGVGPFRDSHNQPLCNEPLACALSAVAVVAARGCPTKTITHTHHQQ